MDGPGQDTESPEMVELFPNIGPTQFVRLAEPDDDRNAQQPAQHRHYFGNGNTGLFYTKSSSEMSGEMAQDNSTIVSQRSLANTVDTDDKTLQIGSLSNKPRPDDPGTKPPIHNHADTETAPNNTSKGIPLEAGCLSFPSPPLMQEEEAILPHRSNGSGEFSPIQGRDSSDNDDDNDDDDDDDVQNHSGDRGPADDDISTQHMGSKRRSLMIAVITSGIAIVVVVIVAVVMVTSAKDEPKKSQSNGNVMITADTSGANSLTPSTTPSRIQTVPPTFDEFADDEGILEFASSSANQTGSNNIFDLETTLVPSIMLSSDGDFGDKVDEEDHDIAVPIEEASARPSMLRRPTQAPTSLL